MGFAPTGILSYLVQTRAKSTFAPCWRLSHVNVAERCWWLALSKTGGDLGYPHQQRMRRQH